jgi:hypothetical protein
MRILACALLLLAARTLGAQAPAIGSSAQANSSACPAPPTRDMRDTARAAPRDTTHASGTNTTMAWRHPTIVLLAEASAREIRFAAQPRIEIRLCGAVTDSVRVLERRNLPERIQPGTVYRDVYIAVEIMGHLHADCLARRIGVAPRDSVSSDNCPSIGIRDTSGSAPNSTRRPPR